MQSYRKTCIPYKDKRVCVYVYVSVRVSMNMNREGKAEPV